ncbi:beta-1,6-N-acetylglucosaminyltransferase [Streptococcus macedonicus]|uniref:beta-1,6-N-acetylglucosaminyltransferase n=1 Tax=Streptococcus macedonicus TaxID=59310 RepID=UPI002244CDD1|nr:beta-1,6-N-acetylglucosaminyltransferase [Streptococcus macedonicus]MCW8519642.1 beta-1,6-N-acetylglucosaminyltransferase [Streptococcus macedonicus]MCW8521110.1 beta-1,6-N-acetylglucosaminyltransferase [Streptococcus macedonicus]
MLNNRHAYLIIAHNNFEQLIFLIKLLDHSQNDIYLFIDGKVEDTSFEQLYLKVNSLKTASNIFFTDRVSVNWGDYSGILAELILFKTAFSKGKYLFYHLISGSDLPLVNQETIHDFFEKNHEYQFLTMVNEETFLQNNVYERVSFHYIWPSISERSFKVKIFGKLFKKFFRKIEIYLNRLFKVDYFSKFHVSLGYASNWVSINEELVSIIISEEDWIKEVFSKSLLCDELFIPTIINKYGLEKKIYYSKGMKNSPSSFQGNFRYINWWDGSPYTWTDSEKDKAEIVAAKKNGYLFSRKFDLERYPKLKDFILEQTK